MRGTRLTLAQVVNRIEMLGQRAQMLARQRVEREGDRLTLIERTVHMAQPDNILRRGFSIVRMDGHAIKSAGDVPAGAQLRIQTSDGSLTAVAQDNL